MNSDEKNNPLVSIVIPCYNHARFVQESIRSVIDQDYKNIEFIIIDDGSTDDSVSKINEMLPACKERFQRFEFRHRPNKGLSRTLNEALEWCRGDYISPLASDDIILPHKTTFLVEKIVETKRPAVFGLSKIYGQPGKIIGGSGKITIHSFDDLFFSINTPWAPSSLICARRLREVGGYLDELKIEDWYMWLKLTENGEYLATYPEVVSEYRRHDNNITNNCEVMQDARMEVLRLFNSNPLYDKAVRFSFLLAARDYAGVRKFHAFKILVKNFSMHRLTFRVFLKIITPLFLIRFIRGW